MELPTDIESLQNLLRLCLAKIASLEAENAELRSRLGMHSGNRDKPPSSDGYKKKPISPGIPKTDDKPSGGQSGHTGKTLEMVSKPDAVLVHHPAQCSCCGRVFGSEELFVVSANRRQVFDIALPKLEVTEHRISEVSCCGVVHRGSFPAEASASVQYGLRCLTLASMLNIDFRMPFAKISQLFADKYGTRLKESTIISANESLYVNMESIEAEIKTALSASELAHFDETGMRVAGKLHWFHFIGTLSSHPKRHRSAGRFS